MNNTIKIYLIALITGLILGMAITLYFQPQKECLEYIVNPEAYVGYYTINRSFYCVWTQDRAYQDYIGTEQHELCHAMVNEGGWEHFCTIDKINKSYIEGD